MSNPILEPTRDRPDIPITYGVPSHEAGMLDWEWVTEQLQKARNYWLVTTYPDGRQHCVPSWGAWVENSLYFSGGPTTRHSKNLETNQSMIAHLESGDKVIIVHGNAEPADKVSAETMSKVETDYVKKYGMGEGATYRLVPRKILAWTDFPTTPTRFLFNQKP
jgi:hypothetical protein